MPSSSSSSSVYSDYLRFKSRPNHFTPLQIDSNVIRSIPVLGRRHLQTVPRDDFLRLDRQLDQPYPTQPPILSFSAFLPLPMVQHLMRNKKDSAIGVKYVQGDSITPMEAVMHTYLTPLAQVMLTGDYHYRLGASSGHSMEPIGEFKGRSILLSAAVQPDFEMRGVMSQVVMARPENEVRGEPLPANFQIDTQIHKDDTQQRDNYDIKLMKHLIYHLTTTKRIQSAKEIRENPESHIKQHHVLEYLERLLYLSSESILIHIVDKYIEWNRNFLSVELMVRTYVEQLNNEFSVLESALIYPYIYTLDPPVIFAQMLQGQGASLLNRFQVIAIKLLSDANKLKMAHSILFNDFQDKTMIQLLSHALHENNPHVHVGSKSGLYKKLTSPLTRPFKLTLQLAPRITLVLHNNSDGFGPNIETEGEGSLDGVIGCFSDAALVLKRQRPDLLSKVWTFN